MDKPKIFFIPTYIGPLKHYARLMPYLEDKYDVGFLIVRPDSQRRQELVKYCQEKKYRFHILDQGLEKDNTIRIPFISPLMKRYRHSLACRNFLETQKPAKIISHKAWSPYDTIFKEANRLGVETIVLQWSSDAGILPGDERRRPFLTRIYLWLLSGLFGILDLFYQEPRFGYAPAIPKKVGVFYEGKKNDYIEKGCRPETIQVVDSFDLQLLHELKNKIDSQPAMKSELLKKYGLSGDKLKIMVIMHRFYLTADSRHRLTMAEQVAHYHELFKLIRSVFSEDEAEIFLKTHPTEIEIYQMYRPYEALGVKIFSGEAKTDELVCLADLYIAEPASSVNYMAVGAGLPAIFVNFSELKIINERANYFYINEVIGDTNKFIERLNQFKQGRLVDSYDRSMADFPSIVKTVDLINQ